MATRSQLNISTTYCESFLVLSLSLRIGKRQLKMETSLGNQLPILRYRDVSFTSEYLKDSLSAVCPLMGVHNVARVRQGALPLFEVDFTEEKALDRFCRSLSNGTAQERLQNKFKGNCGQEVEVMLKLHLILPNAEKKNPSSREVTTDNYQECFSLMKESALFEFEALNIGHDIAADEESIQQDLDIGDLGELLQDLNEMAASWLTMGLLLKISYSKLEIIRKDNRDQSSDCLREMLATWLQSGEASAAEIVYALRSSGRSVLAKKMALKHGVTLVTTTDPRMIAGLEPQDAKIGEKFIQFLIQFAQDSRTQPVASFCALANQSGEIAFKDTHNSDLNDKLDGLKEEEQRVDKTLQDVKHSLSSVQVQINELKSEQDILIKKRENKQSSVRWLQRQKTFKFGKELAQIDQMIKDMEETVSELSTQIDELEKKINAQNKRVKQMNAQLILKEKEKEQLKSEMNEILKEKTVIESELEEKRRLFESEMQRMMYELESSKSKHVEQMSAERQLIDKEKELLERKIQDEKTDFEFKLRRSFENEMQRMKYMYELKLRENKMEMMRDELAHKRKLELVSAQAAMIVPTPSKPTSFLECMEPIVKPIDKASFHEHVQEMHVNSDMGFEKEYLSIPMQIPGLAFSVGGLDCNKSKNKFANIFPYDHNRVTLEAQEGVEGSDYVNASFVDGYSHPGAYIGAQGPLPTTIGDFWRMIWEYKAVNIVMLTGVVEAGRKKCEQYWPEKVGETLDPRNGLMVTLVSHIPFSDFIIRNLKLSKPADESSKSLTVNHFHFTAWPDHGVPQFATSFISFIGRVQMSHKKGLKIPLVVHCSAGVGRTGTFIILDTIMDRLRSEDSINVYELLLAMRKQRMHMVQTQTQYVFIHDALDELITCGETDIAAGNLRARVNKMHKIVPGKNMSGFSEQFQLLEQVCYKPGDAAFSDSTQPYNLPKNRYPDKLPFNVSRPRLRPDGTNGADYINANFVDGYKRRNAYLVTQGPLKSTVNDLWRMIWEFKSRAIVLLCNTIEEGEEKYYQYWPLKKGETAEFGKLKVTLQSEDPHEEYVVRKLHVCNEKGSKQDAEGIVVTQFHYTAWPEHGHPSSTVHIMELMELLTRVQMKSGNKPITVMCNDGVGRSGTFLCIHSQLERLKTDGEVDVFKYLKTARTRRQGLVAELDHYVFCHEVLADYVESFDPYANFKNL